MKNKEKKRIDVYIQGKRVLIYRDDNPDRKKHSHVTRDKTKIGDYSYNDSKYSRARKIVVKYSAEGYDIRIHLNSSHAYKAINKDFKSLYPTVKKKREKLLKRAKNQVESLLEAVDNAPTKITFSPVGFPSSSSIITIPKNQAKRTKRNNKKFNKRGKQICEDFEAIDRSAVYRRDKGLCYLCDRFVRFGTREAHIDHIIPPRANGTHKYDNLALACNKCNISKSDKTPDMLEPAKRGRIEKKLQDLTGQEKFGIMPSVKEIHATNTKMSDLLGTSKIINLEQQPT